MEKLHAERNFLFRIETEIDRVSLLNVSTEGSRPLHGVEKSIVIDEMPAHTHTHRQNTVLNVMNVIPRFLSDFLSPIRGCNRRGYSWICSYNFRFNLFQVCSGELAKSWETSDTRIFLSRW